MELVALAAAAALAFHNPLVLQRADPQVDPHDPAHLVGARVFQRDVEDAFRDR